MQFRRERVRERELESQRARERKFYQRERESLEEF